MRWAANVQQGKTQGMGRARAYGTSDEGRRSMDENRGKAVRLHIVVHLVGRDGHQRVLEGELRVLLAARQPDVVEALTRDAAR